MRTLQADNAASDRKQTGCPRSDARIQALSGTAFRGCRGDEKDIGGGSKAAVGYASRTIWRIRYAMRTLQADNAASDRKQTGCPRSDARIQTLTGTDFRGCRSDEKVIGGGSNPAVGYASRTISRPQGTQCVPYRKKPAYFVMIPFSVPTSTISAGRPAKMPTETTPGMLLMVFSMAIGSMISRLWMSMISLPLSVK